MQLKDSDNRDLPLHKNILMPHNRLAYAIRLFFDPTVLQQQLSRHDRALELEAHLCRREERIGCADVV